MTIEDVVQSTNSDYICFEEIPVDTQRSFLNHDPVPVRLHPSLELNAQKIEVTKHVDFIQINSRSYSHRVLNWSQILKVFCPAENGLLPLVFKPSKRKYRMKKSDSPTFFLGYYGEAKVWLLFNPSERVETEINEEFDTDSECEFEDGICPNILPSYIDDVLMESFGFGIYNAHVEGTSICSSFLYVDENGEVRGNLAKCDKITFYDQEWLHVVERVDDYFSERFENLNEGQQRWFFSHHCSIVIQLYGQNKMFGNAIQLSEYVKQFTNLMLINEIDTVKLAIAENIFYDVQNGCHTVMLRGSAGEQFWRSNSGFWTYPRYFTRFSNIQSRGLPPLHQSRVQRIIKDPNTQLVGFKAYNTDKKFLREAKAKMPFIYGFVSKALLQQRSLSKKHILELLKFKDLIPILKSLKKMSVGLRLETDFELSIDFFDIGQEDDISNEQIEDFNGLLRDRLWALFQHSSVYTPVDGSPTGGCVFGIPITSVCEVFCSDEFYGHVIAVAQQMLAPIRLGVASYESGSLTLPEKEIIAMMEVLLRAFLTGEMKFSTIFGRIGINENHLLNYGFPFISPDLVEIKSKYVAWRRLQFEGEFLTALTDFRHVTDIEKELMIICRDAAVSLNSLTTEAALIGPVDANSFLNLLAECSLKETQKRIVGTFQSKMQKDQLCSEEAAAELVETLNEQEPESFFANLDIIQTVSASFGLKILKNSKSLKELVSRMFPESIAKCKESPFSIFNFMPIWKEYLNFIEARNGPENQSAINRDRKMLIQTFQDYEPKFFSNPGVANFRPTEFTLISLFERSDEAVEPIVEESCLSILSSAPMGIPKMTEPPTLEQFFRAYPEIKAKLDDLMDEIKNKHDTAFTHQRLKNNLKPNQTPVDFFFLCLSILVYKMKGKGKKTTPGRRAAAVLILYTQMKIRDVAAVEQENMNGDETAFKLVERMENLIKEWTQTSHSRGESKSTKGTFQSVSVAPSHFFQLGLCDSRNITASLCWRQLNLITMQDLLSMTGSSLQEQLLFFQSIRQRQGPRLTTAHNEKYPLLPIMAQCGN